MAGCCGDDGGVSPLVGVVLLVAMTVALASAVLLIAMGFSLSFDFFPEEEPCIFEIKMVTHTNKQGAYTLASRVSLWYNNTPPQPVDNAESRVRKLFGWEKKEPERKEYYYTDDLWAQFYKNGKPLNIKVPTLYGYKFIPSHHYGIQTINGKETWDKGRTITINFNDGTFGPGDSVRVEIYSKSEERLISADRYDIAAACNSA